MRKRKRRKEQKSPLEWYLTTKSLHNISEVSIRDNYIGKRKEEDDTFRYIGPFNNRSYHSLLNEKIVPVSVKITENQDRPIMSDEEYWGFFRFESSRLVSIYRGYDKARSVWADPEKLEQDGVGVFVKIHVEE